MKDLIKLSKTRSKSFYSVDSKGVKHYSNLTIMLYTNDTSKNWTVKRDKWNCNGTIQYGYITSHSEAFPFGQTRFYDDVKKFDRAIKRLEAKKEIIRIATM